MVTDVDRMEYSIPLLPKVRKVYSKKLRMMRLSLGKILVLDPIEGESVIYRGSLFSLNTSQAISHYLT